jgi:GT2 family glycosyltransferase
MLDLESPLRTLSLRRDPRSPAYRSLLVVVRRRGVPLGIATFTVGHTASVSRRQLRTGIRGQLGARLEGLAADVSLDRPRAAAERSRRRRLTTAVSVVIPTCADPVRLERCVRSVLASNYENFEVIVVENRPEASNTAEFLAARFPGEERLRCVEEPEAGASRARNAGLARARGEIVAFLDDDVIVDRQWLPAGVEAMSGAADVACVTGLILPLELETEAQLLLEQFAGFGKGFDRRAYRLPEARKEDPLFPYSIGSVGSGASMFIRSDVARALHGFDTRLGPGTPTTGAEDLDLLIRVLRRGDAIVYEPRAIVRHRHPDGLKRLRRQSYRYGVGLGSLLAKQLLRGPERRQLLQAVPTGLRYLRDPGSRKNVGRPAGFPKELVWLERLGMAVGPAAYLLALVLAAPRRVTALRPRRFSAAAARPGSVAVLVAALLSVAAPVAVALGLPSGVRLPVVLGFFCLGPGTAFVSAVRGRHEAALLIAISLATTVLVAQSMLWLDAWWPRPFLYALAASTLLTLIARGEIALSAQLNRNAGREAWRRGRAVLRARGTDRAVAIHTAILISALVAWALALLATDLGRMGGIGLLNALPPLYFAAFALVLVGFSAAATRRDLPPQLLGAYVFVLVIVLHATTALLYDEPRYAWTYRHLGVINLLAATGHADRSIDIYNNWPGFFAANAWLSKTSGVPAISYAGWAQVFFNLLGVLGVRFALRGLIRDEKLLWTAAFLFVLGNWVGQDYLSPQAFGFTLSLVILGLCLRWRRTREREPSAPSLPPAATLLAAGACYLAVLISHQLTPILLIISVTALAVVVRRVPLWVPVAMVALEAWWVALAWPFVSTHFAIIAPAGTGAAAPTRDLARALPGAALSFYAPAAVMAAMAAFGLLGAWQRRRAGSRILVPVLLIAAPVAAVAFQSYGGEGPYRAFLFALPWLAFLAAALMRSRFPRLLAASAVLGVPLLFAYFGQELANRVPRDDVAAARWYETHAPPDSIRIRLAPSAPDRLTARYPLVSLADPDALLDLPAFVGHRLGRADVPRLEALIRRQRGHRAFVSLSLAQQDYARLNGLLPDGSVRSFVGALEHTRAFHLVFRRPTAWVFEYAPGRARRIAHRVRQVKR